MIVYVPGLLSCRSIWPVLTLTNTSAGDDDVNKPALAPTPKLGKGLVAPRQCGPVNENVASGALVMVTFAKVVLGQGELLVNETVYVPITLAETSISPVLIFANTKPVVELNIPPPTVCITGAGVIVVPDLQYVPDEYSNSGSITGITFTVTALLGLVHPLTVVCT